MVKWDILLWLPRGILSRGCPNGKMEGWQDHHSFDVGGFTDVQILNFVENPKSANFISDKA